VCGTKTTKETKLIGQATKQSRKIKDTSIMESADYKSMESKIREIGKELTSPVSKGKGRQLFGKPNVMTSDVAYFGKFSKGGKWFYVELSYSAGFDSAGCSYIVGVTFTDDNMEKYYDFNGCCHEWSEVREAINKFKTEAV